MGFFAPGGKRFFKPKPQPWDGGSILLFDLPLVVVPLFGPINCGFLPPENQSVNFVPSSPRPPLQPPHCLLFPLSLPPLLRGSPALSGGPGFSRPTHQLTPCRKNKIAYHRATPCLHGVIFALGWSVQQDVLQDVSLRVVWRSPQVSLALRDLVSVFAVLEGPETNRNFQGGLHFDENQREFPEFGVR